MSVIRTCLLGAAIAAALLALPARAGADTSPVQGAWAARGGGHSFDFSVQAIPTSPTAVHLFVVGLHLYGTKFPNIQIQHDGYFHRCVKKGLRSGGSARTCVRGHFRTADSAQGDGDYHRPGKSRSLNWTAGWAF